MMMRNIPRELQAALEEDLGRKVVNSNVVTVHRAAVVDQTGDEKVLGSAEKAKGKVEKRVREIMEQQ